MIDRVESLFANPVQGMGMVGCLQVLDQTLSSHGDSLLHDKGGFPTRKGIPLEGVAGVG